MGYCLCHLVSGSSGVVHLEKDEFDLLVEATDSLIELHYIEEKLDLVLENYCEFETELLSVAVRHSLFNEIEYDAAQEVRVLLNRRLLNLLSSCRTYLDHGNRHLCAVYGKDSEQVDDFCFLKSQIYDERLGYRLFETLRNMVQHRSYAVTNITYSSKRVERESASQLMYRMVPAIELKALEADKKVKSRLISELREYGEKIDLRPFLRDYITDLLELNQLIRRVAQADADRWEGLVRGAIQRFEAETGENAPVVALCRTAEVGRYSKAKDLFVDALERRKLLMRKNSTTGELRMRFASNEL